MINSNTLLAGLPTGLRDPLLKYYQSIIANYIEHRWEPSELSGGKFCETVYTIVKGRLDNSYPDKPFKPADIVKACRALETVPTDINRVGDRSLRILIPRMIPPLYEIRNNRGVGHVGGDVDPNFLDATAVYGMTSWILAELIRIFHNVPIQEAQSVVNTMIERKIPLIWEVEQTRRILDPNMNAKDQVLLLLHGKISWVEIKDLFEWIEYSDFSLFKTRILSPLHKARMIEYDKIQSRVQISPLGTKAVEAKL